MKNDPTVSADNLGFLMELEEIIRARAESNCDESYTATLIASGTSRVAQKVGEEALELALASVAGNRAEQLNESADLVYHLLVLLHCNDSCLADVAGILRERHQQS